MELILIRVSCVEWMISMNVIQIKFAAHLIVNRQIANFHKLLEIIATRLDSQLDFYFYITGNINTQMLKI